MVCVAQPADIPALCQLFVQAFGGTVEMARQVMEEFAGAGNVYLVRQEGGPVAMLCAVPVTLNGRKGAYYYGVCTDKSQQGKGIMSQMLKEVGEVLKGQGYAFATLIPASESLFDFYAQRGFEKAMGLRCLQRPIRRNLWAQADFDAVTARNLRLLRSKYAHNSVMLNDKGYVLVLTDLYSMGATIVSTDEGYGIYFKKDDILDFVELFAESDRAAENLMEAARDKTGAEQAQITLGASQNLFLGDGKPKDYGMISFFGEPFDVSESYMRLMLDME
ncbi:MAG: GNAT family N-acetyltransferase [Candidatus Fournierella pullistercoris]|uniref:GNAT family N-acetyltransferase n=1 Tax=Candidatus Allofournierella pullistercoris TaxID=2838597 RepID=A0A948WQE2_9FIRM|nr:GNAT family N-acetyltransferase [Candidatus Fournierella pullistercoris]